MSRGVRRNALVEASEPHQKERLGLLSVNEKDLGPVKRQHTESSEIAPQGRLAFKSSTRLVPRGSCAPTSFFSRRMPLERLSFQTRKYATAYFSV